MAWTCHLMEVVIASLPPWDVEMASHLHLCYTVAQSAAAAASVATDASTTLPPWDVDSVVVTSVVTIIVLAENTTKITCSVMPSPMKLRRYDTTKCYLLLPLLLLRLLTTLSVTESAYDAPIDPLVYYSVGVARIWCQEGHKSYCVFTLGDCRHLQNCLLWGAELIVRRTYCILCYTDAQSAAAAASVATDASTTLPPWDVDSVVVTSVVTTIVLAKNITKNTWAVMP